MKTILFLLIFGTIGLAQSTDPKPVVAGMTCEDTANHLRAQVEYLKAELAKANAIKDALERSLVDYIPRPENNAAQALNAIHQNLNETKCGNRGIMPDGRCVPEPIKTQGAK